MPWIIKNGSWTYVRDNSTGNTNTENPSVVADGNTLGVGSVSESNQDSDPCIVPKKQKKSRKKSKKSLDLIEDVMGNKRMIITVDKVFIDDVKKARRVVDIQNCVGYNDLPPEYLRGYPRFSGTTVLAKKCCIIRDENVAIAIKVDDVMLEEDFQRIVDIMRRAGDRLYQINKRSKWSGTETLEI